MAKERLHKVLAASGIASRRRCEELILDGVVRVNRKVIDELPAFADPEVDVITVHGKRIEQATKVYFLLNKPKGVISTSYDPYGRKKVTDLIKTDQRIVSVGRLDADTTGALLLTNDSALVNKLTHPRYKIPKTYVVEVKGEVGEAGIDKLKKGVWLAEGRTGKSAVKILRRTHSMTTLQIIISQGLNRQIRRMLAKVGYPVRSLKRAAIGKITLKGVGIGKYRELTEVEIKGLKKGSRGKVSSDSSTKAKSTTDRAKPKSSTSRARPKTSTSTSTSRVRPKSSTRRAKPKTGASWAKPRGRQAKSRK